MRSLLLSTLFVILSTKAQAAILPAVFYQSPVEQERYCRAPEFQTEEHWRELTSRKIDALINKRDEVVQNSFVSLSYLEFFRISPKTPAGFMGYVYANASHHLGRLIRYTKWPKNHPLKDVDRDLIKGKALRIATAGANHQLSERLMFHSLKLYKELSWSLAAAILCGQDYPLKFVKNASLKEAYSAQTINEFVKTFISYEQTFLQTTLYQDLFAGAAAKLGVLDEMRFISFNGEEKTSFKKWCETAKCTSTSYDLKNRITFDILAVADEIMTTNTKTEVLNKRLELAKIEEVVKIFINL